MHKAMLTQFVPMTKEEIKAREWDTLDILFIYGDAYIDHASFGIPLLSRLLISKGYRVGIISQPAITEEAVSNIKKLGNPKLFVGIGSGVVDSMINNYTANKKKRSDDVYSPGKRGGTRPDYATKVYANLARQAFPDIPIIIGGIEASLRRLAHYDYWQNKVKPAIITEINADFLVYGMGEKQILTIANALKENERKKAFDIIKQTRGICYLDDREKVRSMTGYLLLPSYEEVKNNKKKFARATLLALKETNCYNAKTTLQYHGKNVVVVNPPPLPLTTHELDSLYDLPFTRKPHFSYTEKIPAHEMIKFSITINRGCFGGCTFCGLSLHQGKIIQSRSIESILKEIKTITMHDEFTGFISDIGGPTANMYQMNCKSAESLHRCKSLSCLHPRICNNLNTDHSKLTLLLKESGKISCVKKTFVASGVRHDLALRSPEYINELVSNHTGGHLKIAPEHCDNEILYLMKKPSFEFFIKFQNLFNKISKEKNLTQYIVPYFISNFPGSTIDKMEKLSSWLKLEKRKLQQVQSYIPLPMTLASAMYWSGIDPEHGNALHVAKEFREKKFQQTLLQPFRKHYQKY
jgi:uncharacterized radical SAM protein YgiQ